MVYNIRLGQLCTLSTLQYVGFFNQTIITITLEPILLQSASSVRLNDYWMLIFFPFVRNSQQFPTKDWEKDEYGGLCHSRFLPLFHLYACSMEFVFAVINNVLKQTGDFCKKNRQYFLKAVVSVETFPLFVLSYLQGIDSSDKTLII